MLFLNLIHCRGKIWPQLGGGGDGSMTWLLCRCSLRTHQRQNKAVWTNYKQPAAVLITGDLLGFFGQVWICLTTCSYIHVVFCTIRGRLAAVWFYTVSRQFSKYLKCRKDPNPYTEIPWSTYILIVEVSMFFMNYTLIRWYVPNTLFLTNCTQLTLIVFKLSLIGLK